MMGKPHIKFLALYCTTINKQKAEVNSFLDASQQLINSIPGIARSLGNGLTPATTGTGRVQN